MNAKHLIRKILWTLGIDLMRFRHPFHPVWQRRQILAKKGVTLVLDVGANAGDFAVSMREEIGFRGRMISFEPLNDVHQQLQQLTARDANWTALNIALGDTDGESEINVSANSVSSSLLEMLPAHAEAAPTSVYSGRQKITVRRLDSIRAEHCRPDDVIYLKLDTQGFEAQVLAGAAETLAQVAVLQVELSMVPLYAGAPVATEMITKLQQMGFTLALLEPVFRDKTTHALLQIDGVFLRA